MNLIWISFLAGVLTILAPCIFSLLPVILGGSLGQKDLWRPMKVALSLGISVLIFTLFLKSTSLLLPIPSSFWKIFAGTLVSFVGLAMLFPEIWEWCASHLNLYKTENWLSRKSNGEEKSAYVLGAALGPVFSSCSPTYSLILAVVLPQKFLQGSFYLLMYTLGLVSVLVLIGYGGQSITKKLRFAVKPKGWFKRLLGVMLIITGVSVVTGLDKQFEAWILEQGYLGPIHIEQSLLEQFNR